MPSKDQKSILLFDGICNLCNASVQFILKKDQKEQFLFASLQSDAAEKLLLQYKDKKIGMDSIVLIEDGKVYQKSTAVLKICQHLNWPWRIFLVGAYIPKSWRDKLYDLIAKNRYRWFGKKDTCTVMIPAYKNRFI
ncbi:thiol-disulfide oxidoreductase DCC family protein [Lutimonas sp.]|uniref:thiol-disulfide oxidoreductase DCC family protein n=1 Tax=Lutimonas sp. TaxID=1872403 RepID=UPI003C74D67A